MHRQPVRKSCVVSYSYPFSVVKMRFWVLLNLLIFFAVCISVTSELGPGESLGAALLQGSRPLLNRMKHVRRSWQRKNGQNGARANNSGSKTSQKKLPDGAETSSNHTQENASESSASSVQQASPVSGRRTKTRVRRVQFQLPPEFKSPPPSSPEEEAPSFTMEPGITFVQPEPGVMITTEERPSLSSFVFLMMPVLGALSYKGRMPFLIRKDALTDPKTGEWSRRMVWVRRDLRPYSPQEGRLGMGAHEVVDRLAELLIAGEPEIPDIDPGPLDESCSDDDERVCCVCCEREKNTELETCGHEVCLTCAKRMKTISFKCPICQCKVTGWHQNVKNQKTLLKVILRWLKRFERRQLGAGKATSEGKNPNSDGANYTGALA